MLSLGKHQRTTVLTISSVLLALAPKCPFCFLAYFGIVGVATASASAYRAWLPPITAVWLLLTVATLALRTGGQRRFGPIALGLIAAFAVFAGKFIVSSQPMIYGGIAVLVGAALLSSWHQRAKASEFCAECEPSLSHDQKAGVNVHQP